MENPVFRFDCAEPPPILFNSKRKEHQGGKAYFSVKLPNRILYSRNKYSEFGKNISIGIFDYTVGFSCIFNTCFPLFPIQKQERKKEIPAYFSSLLSPSFSSTRICCIAIRLSFTSRSPCGIPWSIKTAFKFSILDRQINSFMEA